MIQVNDANFYYELEGSGDPLVLISGYTSDHTTWANVVGPLSEHFQVLVFDNRGSGQTTDDGRPLSAELMADDVIALTEALKLTKPNIAGSSMGGTIAQCVASRHADKIGRLAVLAAPAKWRSSMLTGLRAPLNMRKAEIDFSIQFDCIVSGIFGQKFIENPDNLIALKERILSNPYPQSLADQLRQYDVLTQFDGRANLRNITMPTLLVGGIEDIITLPFELEKMAKQLPNAEIKQIACAHAFSIEAPVLLSQLLIEFMASPSAV